MNKKTSFRPLNSENNTSKRDSALGSLLHSEHIVEIEKMAIGGDGVARIPYEGKTIVVFVGKAAPLDTLRIKIITAEKTFLFGQIIDVVKPGPSRRAPPCPYAVRCGGCSWQQISDEEQIAQKEKLLKELFKKFLPASSYQLEETVRSPKLFNYRNRIQLKQQGQWLGYFQDKSHEIVDIESCLIADKIISDEIPKLKRTLKAVTETQKYELKINQSDLFEFLRIGDKGQGLSFSQVNTSLNALLASSVVEIIKKIEPTQMTELYAGSGNFTFALSNALPKLAIDAVEMNSQLTTAATKKVIAENLQKRITFFTADCDAFASRRPVSSQLVLLDPPRAGASENILKKLIDSSCANILYISCQPVSLARDLQILDLQKHGYSIEWLQIFDMFPQTDHFETLVWLKKQQ